MRFTDFDQFKIRHPAIAAILEHPDAEFLLEMKLRITTGKDLAPRHMKALRKWAGTRAKTIEAAESMPGLHHVVRDELVSVTKVFTSEDEGYLMVEFIHPNGWRGRIKDVTSSSVIGGIRAAGFDPKAQKDTPEASAGTPFNLLVERAHVTWAKPEAAFVILGKPKRRSRGSRRTPGTPAKAPVISLPGDAARGSVERGSAPAPALPPEPVTAKVSTHEELEAAVIRARRELGTEETCHEWEYDAMMAVRTCIHCDEQLDDLTRDDVPMSKWAEACAARTDNADLVEDAEPEPDTQDDRERTEREQLLPNFDDWRSKLAL